MTANPFAALLDGVPRLTMETTVNGEQIIVCNDGPFVRYDRVLAALAAAVPADLTEVGNVLEGVTGNAWRIHRIASLNVETTDGRSIASCAGYSDNRRMAEVNEENAANARFIAWCREGVPALLARIAGQEAQMKGLAMDVLAEWEKDQRFIKELCDQIEQLNAKVADWSVRAEAAETALSAERAKVARLVEAGPPFFFDRYINGVRMAEDVCVERETTLEGAMRVAARIAAKGPNGEPPVLVYRSTETAALAAMTKERDEALASNRGLVRLNEATEARAERFRSALEEIAEYDTGATAGLAYTARAAIREAGQ